MRERLAVTTSNVSIISFEHINCPGNHDEKSALALLALAQDEGNKELERFAPNWLSIGRPRAGDEDLARAVMLLGQQTADRDLEAFGRDWLSLCESVREHEEAFSPRLA